MDRRALFLGICWFSIFNVAISAQTPLPSPAYEVVSIKMDKSGADQDKLITSPDGLTATNLSVQNLIAAAYHLSNPDVRAGLRAIPGAPGWIVTDLYDVQAKMADSDVAALSKLSDEQKWEQQRLMLQALLADRFKLKLHQETRESSVYKLMPAKGGIKVKPVTEGAATRYDSNRNHIKYFTATMSDLTARLAYLLGRPVLDETGLSGKYDISVSWTAEQTAQDSPPVSDAGLSLFTALQEQLGLKLEPAKGQVQVVVIDHIERPTEN
jgi:uncharacterized protein (TIGR03435 family)